ncbi:NAD(P)-binding domain-containing protein, partial [Microbacterium sp.]|uniref:NAD(P)-binding domain-containing protein n=1 Tax=Microbacterium sp. TaxID=51671 RepID=UPI002E31F672
EVLGVTREGMDRTRTKARFATPFSLRVRTPDGVIEDVAARAVIDASGTYRSPNSMSSGGLALLGMAEIADRVTDALPDVLGRDRALFAGRHTTVVGAGHSAANTLLGLVELTREEPGTTVTWLIRNTQAVRVSSSPDDELADRARLGGRVDQAVADGRIGVLDGFEIIRAHRTGDAVELVGHRRGEVATHITDMVVNATGFRPDLDMLREIRLELDDIVEAPKRLAPLIDPNVHSCGSVEPHGFRELSHPEKGFFVVGMKSYGRAPTFLLATGYEQVRSVTAWLAGDTASAANVELVLPATGVCSTDASDGGGCCS